MSKSENLSRSFRSNTPTPAHEALPLCDAFVEFMRVERNFALATCHGYLSDLALVQRALAETDKKSLVMASTEDLRDVLNHLDTFSPASPRTRARRVSALRTYFKFLYYEEKVDQNPACHLEMPRCPKALPKVLSEAQTEALLTTLTQNRDPSTLRLRCMLEVLYATGMRVSELVCLKLADVMTALRSGEIPAMLLIIGKGQKQRQVYLTEIALGAIQDYLRVRAHFLPAKTESPWLFPSRSAAGYITRQRFAQCLKTLAIDAGLPPEAISPHVIRHAFATHLLSHGADLISIKTLLGHEDLATTEIYTHVAGRHLSEAVTAHHPLSRDRKNIKNNHGLSKVSK